MKVTAIVPCHNHVRWVHEAINSVAAQDYQEKRIIVVDDGSSDGSADSIVARIYKGNRHYKEGEEPVLFWGRLKDYSVDIMVARFSQARGPSFARNAGMKLAWNDTDAFAFLDSDDLYLQGKISKSVEIMNRFPAAAIVYSDYDHMDYSANRVRTYCEPFSRERLLQECIVNPKSLVRKSAIEKVGGFDENLRTCEDFDMWIRLTEHFMAYHIPECLAIKRVGPHSSTDTVQKATWEANYRRVYEKLQERMRA